MIRLAFILALLASPAWADARKDAKFIKITKAPASVSYQPGCGERANVLDFLAGKYGEARVGAGVSRLGPIEIYAGPSGSFTVLLTKPDGSMSCIISDGKAWRAAPVGGGA